MLVALRPQHKADTLLADKDMARLERFLSEGWGNALSHMLFLGDKSFYWAQEGRVLFAFARVRDKLVVLGDPLGPMNLLNNGISEFRQAADLYGLSVVFYQATPAYLPLYHEQGYRFFKLGEEALVPLADFSISGSRNASLRSVKGRFEREGYHFEITEAQHSKELLQELRLLSEEWLAGRMEKKATRWAGSASRTSSSHRWRCCADQRAICWLLPPWLLVMTGRRASRWI
ncbi:phosphatidylglycerol lysyltransferase domain-containing protein [Paenibacillus rhizoplanae]